MSTVDRNPQRRRYMLLAIACTSVIALIAGALWTGASLAARNAARPGTPSAPYPNMPAFAPIGVRVDRYVDIPESAKGPALDPAKRYRTQTLGDGLYMVTDGSYQSMFMTYEDGVVVVDAPPYGELITHIVIPHLPAARRSHYLKVRDRASYEFALASAAVVLDLDGDTIRAARLGLGGIATKPWRAIEAEHMLTGRKATDETCRDAAEIGLTGAVAREHNRFKIELAKRTIVRALATARDKQI